MRLERREFLRIALAASGGVLVNKLLNHPPAKALGPDLSAESESFYTPEKENLTILDKLGLHSTPIEGGGERPETTIFTAINLGINFIVALTPSEEFLKIASQNDLPVITRWYTKNNILNEKKFRETIKRIKKYQDYNIVIPFNEVNLLRETGNEERTPKQHAEEYIQALHIGKEEDCIIPITPMSQGHGPGVIDDYIYLPEMLLELKNRIDLSLFKDNLALCLHRYILRRGDDDFIQGITSIYNSTVDILNMHLPVYVTEAGLYQDRKILYDETIVAAETVKILKLSLPSNIPVETIDLWNFSGFYQRPQDHRVDNEDNPAFDLEPSALIDTDGRPKEAFIQIEKMVMAKKRERFMPNKQEFLLWQPD